MAVFSVDLAGVSLQCSVRFPETKVYFQSWLSPDRSAAEPPESGGYTIPDADWDSFPGINMPQCPHTEYSMLVGYLSDRLIEEDRCAIHAVAIRWNGAAYLICGESGVGKSTQTKWLQALRPGEFSVICGDRPILEFRPSAPAPCHSERSEESVPSVPFPRHSERSEESASPVPFHRHSERSEESASPVPERSAPVAAHSVRHSAAQSILVHPSPWNGKENWHGAETAPLAGIILLVRGERNEIMPLSERQAIVPLYKALIHTGWDTEKIIKAAKLEEKLLQNGNIWLLTSREVPQSTELLLNAVFPKIDSGEGTV